LEFLACCVSGINTSKSQLTPSLVHQRYHLDGLDIPHVRGILEWTEGLVGTRVYVESWVEYIEYAAMEVWERAFGHVGEFEHPI
jgi:hypothetical protein